MSTRARRRLSGGLAVVWTVWLCLCLASLQAPLRAATIYKFNFRATAGFVSDGANESPVLAEASGHVYSNGATAGFSAGSPATVDRTTGTGSPELSGINYNAAGATMTFRVDLDASGTWDLRLAIGDTAAHAVTTGIITVKDNASTILTINNVNTATGGSYTDAAGSLLTAANWGASNAAAHLTFASTICFITVDPNGGDYIPFAHVSLVATGGGATPVCRRLLLGVGC